MALTQVPQGMLGTNIAGNGPTFNAYQSSSQTISAGASTKLQFQAEAFDTAAAFDSTTNYRFQPTVAGYYLFAYGVRTDSTVSALHAYLHKNGTPVGAAQFTNTALGSFMSAGSTLTYMNCSTDYAEVYSYCGSTVGLTTGQASTYFSGFLARTA